MSVQGTANAFPFGGVPQRRQSFSNTRGFGMLLFRHCVNTHEASSTQGGEGETKGGCAHPKDT